MRISALAERTGVSVATLKYYLREGLLPPGQLQSRTQAEYSEEHVDRVRLIRALTGPGALSLADAKRALDAISGSRLDVMRAAHLALYPDAATTPTPSARTRQLVEQWGWMVDPGHPAIADLDQALTALNDVGMGTEDHLSRYAAAMHDVAEVDVGGVPVDPGQAVREVVLGTVLLEPVLQALRRLAQQDVARRREQGQAGTTGMGN